MRPFILSFAIAVAALTAGAQTKAEREVRKANEDFDRAIISRNADALERLLADEVIMTLPNGKVVDKAAQLRSLRTDPVVFEFGRSDDVRVKMYGKTAVVTGRFTGRIKWDGKDESFVERYTAVFVKRDGRWQMVAEQAMEIK